MILTIWKSVLLALRQHVVGSQQEYVGFCPKASYLQSLVSHFIIVLMFKFKGVIKVSGTLGVTGPIYKKIVKHYYCVCSGTFMYACIEQACHIYIGVLIREGKGQGYVFLLRTLEKVRYSILHTHRTWIKVMIKVWIKMLKVDTILINISYLNFQIYYFLNAICLIMIIIRNTVLCTCLQDLSDSLDISCLRLTKVQKLAQTSSLATTILTIQYNAVFLTMIIMRNIGICTCLQDLSDNLDISCLRSTKVSQSRLDCFFRYNNLVKLLQIDIVAFVLSVSI
eukprot:TRINITY_DN10844_c1_g1_i2.p1 TRINITY_DN10844_c1_g1~~TRINITY_DN10844_c1_g1_i2.p1  ORF type:complete len:281 (+),score=-17.88 TRINITY_DN10844_c1_g1_i2:516-1358(+)